MMRKISEQSGRELESFHLWAVQAQAFQHCRLAGFIAQGTEVTTLASEQYGDEYHTFVTGQAGAATLPALNPSARFSCVPTCHIDARYLLPRSHVSACALCNEAQPIGHEQVV